MLLFVFYYYDYNAIFSTSLPLLKDTFSKDISQCFSEINQIVHKEYSAVQLSKVLCRLHDLTQEFSTVKNSKVITAILFEILYLQGKNQTEALIKILFNLIAQKGAVLHLLRGVGDVQTKRRAFTEMFLDNLGLPSHDEAELSHALRCDATYYVLENGFALDR